MTKISELIMGPVKGEIIGTVKSIEGTRAFNKFGRELKVANAILEDESGEIKISLWNDDITRIQTGNRIKIANGYVNEFQGEKQLSAGKFGKIEIIEGKDGEDTSGDDSGNLSEGEGLL